MIGAEPRISDLNRRQSSTTFDVNAFIEQQYGFKARPFKRPAAQGKQEPFTQRTNSQIYKEIGGVPYYLPIQLGGLELLHCIMSVTAQKNIVETPMVARRGTVKELISAEDYKFSVDGFLIRADGSFPDTEIDELVQLYERNEAIKMVSVLSDYFLLAEDRVVIKSLDFPTTKGIMNVKQFRMSIVSDTIFDLIIS